MNVLAVNDVSRGGGAAALFQRANRLLRKAGHTVEEFTGDEGAIPSLSAQTTSGPRSRRLPGWMRSAGAAVFGDATALKRALRHVRAPDLQRRLAERLNAARPDVAHVHNLHNRLSPQLLKTLSARNLPVVFQVSDYFAFCNNYAAYNNTLDAPCKRCIGGNAVWAAWYGCTSYGNEYSRFVAAAESLRRFVMEAQRPWDAVDLFVVTSQAARDLMREWGVPDDRLSHILNPMVVSDFTASAELGDEIVFYGGYLPHKGPGVFLSALEHLPAGTHVGVYLMGMPASYGEKLREAAARRSLRLTVRPDLRWDNGLRSVVARARAIVVPSRWWVTSENVVYEAMLLGRAVLVGNRGGNAELIRDGETGLLFDPDSPTALAATMAAVARDAALASRLGTAARTSGEKQFSEEGFLAALTGAYARATELRRARTSVR